MTTFLLDVNVLLALCDSLHVQHEAAHRWFADRGQASWATCPVTENGFIRISSHPSYPNRPGDVGAVTEILRQLCANTGHVFWGEGVTLRDVLQPGVLVTHAQVTDIYLLALAAHKHGLLATFDRHIPVAAVQGGEKAIHVIAV